MGEILAGMLLIVNSELAIMQFYRLGYSSWITFAIVAGWTTFRLLTDFFVAAAVDRWIAMPRHWDEAFNRILWIRKLRQPMANGKKRTLAWLLRHSRLIILLILFLPFFSIPFLWDIAIATARLSRMKRFLPWMILANAARVAVVIFLIYYVF